MKVSARSAGGQVCILHLARFNDFPDAKIVAIEPVQKTKPREKMVYFSLTAKFEWLTLVRPTATAGAHSRSRNAFGEETLTSCLTRVGGPEIWLVLPIPVLSIHDLSTVRSGYGPLMKVSARSAGGQVCILHLARFNDFPDAKIVAIEPVQKTKPREKMVYFSLTAKFEWLTLVRPTATAGAHSRSRNAFGEETLTSCLTRVGGPEISLRR